MRGPDGAWGLTAGVRSPRTDARGLAGEPVGRPANPEGGRAGADVVPLCGLPADLHHYVLTKWQKPHMLAVGRGRIPARGGR